VTAKTWLSRFWRLGLINSLTISSAIATSGELGLAQTSNIIPDDTLGNESSQVIPLDSEGFPNGKISSRVEEKAEGNGGDIAIRAGNLTLINRGSIDTSTNGKGDGGRIKINTNDTVSLDNSDIISSGFSQVGGNGGGIEITTENLTLKNNGQIDTSTFGKGNGGNIKINAAKSVFIDRLFSGIASLVAPSAQGDGGEIKIITSNLILTNGGQINTSTKGQGDAGNININATDTVSIDRSVILSAGFATEEENGGEIQIKTNNLNLTNQSQINTSISGRGNAGSINITADNTISIDRGSTIFSSLVFPAEGNAGEIDLKTSKLFLNDGAVISTLSSGLGNAGNIKVNAKSITLDNNSSIAASNTPLVDISTTLSGGNIDLQISDNIVLRNSDITTQASSNANGGNINITADAVIAFDDSDIFSYAEGGTGGNITLYTPAYFGSSFSPKSSQIKPDPSNNFFDNNDRADLNATGAVSGVVTVPDVSFIQNSLADLPDNAINTENLIANSCVVRDRKQEGKFIITGKGGLPENPADASVSSYPTGEVRGVKERSNNSNQSNDNDAIVEPQGVYRLTNGQLVLSRECDL
jgi:large exoprotein involved in heme utilization and adhesion